MRTSTRLLWGRMVVALSLALAGHSSWAAPGDTSAVSAPNSSEAPIASGQSGESIASSLDGRFIVFVSEADNLVSGDTNNHFDVFVRDRAANSTTRVSVASNGAQGNDGSGSPPSAQTVGTWRLSPLQATL